MNEKELSLVFGKSPKNENESKKYAAILAQGNYPAGLDGCFTVTMTGGCGTSCYVYQNGDCEYPDEFFEKHHEEMSKEEFQEFNELYPQSLYNKEV